MGRTRWFFAAVTLSASLLGPRLASALDSNAPLQDSTHAPYAPQSTADPEIGPASPSSSDDWVGEVKDWGGTAWPTPQRQLMGTVFASQIDGILLSRDGGGSDAAGSVTAEVLADDRAGNRTGEGSGGGAPASGGDASPTVPFAPITASECLDCCRTSKMCRKGADEHKVICCGVTSGLTVRGYCCDAATSYCAASGE